MLRTLWTSFVAGVTIILTAVIFLAAPWPWDGAVERLGYADGVVAVMAGLLFFLLATFVIYAVVDGIRHAAANRRLSRMESDGAPAPDRFLAAFPDTGFRERAVQYTATLEQRGAATPRHATDEPAATWFDRRGLVDRPLLWGFFRGYPWLLVALGGIGLLLSIVAGLRAIGETGDALALADELEVGASLLVAGVVAALLSVGILRGLRDMRARQLERTWTRVDALYFQPGAERRESSIQEFLEAEFASTRTLLRSQHQDLRELLKGRSADLSPEIVSRLDSALGRMPEAVTAALDAPLRSLSQAVETAREDRSESAAKLVDGAMRVLRDEVQAAQRRQSEDAAKSVAAASALAAELQKRFEAATAAFDRMTTQAPETLSAMGQLSDRLMAAAEAVGKMADRLASAAEQPGVPRPASVTVRPDPSVTNALKELGDELDRITQALPELRPAKGGRTAS